MNQANYRKTNVATKLKVTYVKDTSLNVSITKRLAGMKAFTGFYFRCKCITKPVSCTFKQKIL